MRRARIAFVALVLLLPFVAGGAGAMMGSGILHPVRKTLAPEQVQQADLAFERVSAKREEFEVQAGDGAILRGWKARAPVPNGD
jgi:hypothetical protein